MIDCGELRDRMPDVARGAAAWTAAETAHLAACPECALEWRIARAGAGLHADLVVAPDRIAQAVMTRLRETPPVEFTAIRRLPWRGAAIGLLAAAASVVLILSGPQVPRPGASAALAILPELQALDERQLESILQSLGPSAADATPGLVPHLEDLTDSELEQLLRSGGGE